jgi:2-iminobutanoate/2-iminopropanoate deaminase
VTHPAAALVAVVLAAISVGAADLAAQHPGADAEFLAPGPDAPFSRAVRVGNTIYLAGTLGTTGEGLVEGGIRPETRQTLENIRATLERFGATMEDMVKCTVFLADVAEWAAMNEAYVPFFPRRRPARTALGVAGLPLDARVEIECIAVIGAREAP